MKQEMEVFQYCNEEVIFEVEFFLRVSILERLHLKNSMRVLYFMLVWKVQPPQ